MATVIGVVGSEEKSHQDKDLTPCTTVSHRGVWGTGAIWSHLWFSEDAHLLLKED